MKGRIENFQMVFDNKGYKLVRWEQTGGIHNFCKKI